MKKIFLASISLFFLLSCGESVTNAVNSSSLSSITAEYDESTSKNSYFYSESLNDNIKNFTITATYDNGATKIIPITSENLEITGISSSISVGWYSVTVTYIENKITKTDYVEVPVCSSIFASDDEIRGVVKSASTIIFPQYYNGTKLTTISNEAFMNNSTITNVYIPDTVKSIDSSAFYNCSNLKTIHLPDGITYLGNKAFKSIYKSVNVTINSVQNGNSNNVKTYFKNQCDSASITFN